MDELNLIQLEGEDSAFGLIDFSSENDSLVLDDESSPQRHDLLTENWKDSHSIDLFDSMNDGKEAEAEAEEFTVESIDQIKLSPDVSDSSVPERVRRKGKYNMRKSLAWDSAFFTSAGVLDPEELSGIIGEATRSAGNQVLPGITEDVVRSTDSISFLGSESLTADHVEAELCDDIRATTQKASKKLIAPGYKEASKKSLTLPSSRKMVPTTQNQAKLKTAMKKPDVMSKAIPKQNLRAQGPVRTAKQNSALSEVTKSTKVTDSITKLPGIIGNGRSIMAKKDSFGATQVNKNEIDKLRTNSGASKGAQDIKVFSISGARRILPKPTVSSKSSSVSFSTLKTGLTTDSSVSSNARRKVSEKQLKPPSGSTLKTPTKPTAINRRSSSILSTYLKSSKNSGGVSPASSISEWSSVSSTSSSTINGKFNNSRTSFDASSCQSLDNESFASDLDHTLEGIDSNTQKTKIPTNRSGPLSHPASSKPSGLRMPSPTIGFFNGVKSVQTPNGAAMAAQFHHRSVLCRQAKQVNTTKTKIGKNLNTQSQIIAPDVISHDSDDGPTESNGSEINIDVIDSDLNASNREHKESLVIYKNEEIAAKDGEKEIEPVGNIDQIQGGGYLVE